MGGLANSIFFPTNALLAVGGWPPGPPGVAKGGPGAGGAGQQAGQAGAAERVGDPGAHPEES